MSRQEYGPSVTENSMYNAVIDFMDRSRNYVARLSPFDKYILWRYTIGSASVNSLLIQHKLSDNSPRWTYLFFKYYHNSGDTRIGRNFVQWKQFFSSPESFNKLPREEQIGIAGQVIVAYSNALQGIILGAPPVTNPFHVFKVASKYPGLPSMGDKLPSTVVQMPFNSTTISSYFNFAPFIAPTADCCLFDISLPRGSKCLYIPDDLHAYTFEHEIILPVGAEFIIEGIDRSVLNYIDPKTVNIVNLQDKDKIKPGPYTPLMNIILAALMVALVPRNPFLYIEPFIAIPDDGEY